jgi:hypothetical protein
LHKKIAAIDVLGRHQVASDGDITKRIRDVRLRNQIGAEDVCRDKVTAHCHITVSVCDVRLRNHVEAIDVLGCDQVASDGDISKRIRDVRLRNQVCAEDVGRDDVTGDGNVSECVCDVSGRNDTGCVQERSVDVLNNIEGCSDVRVGRDDQIRVDSQSIHVETFGDDIHRAGHKSIAACIQVTEIATKWGCRQKVLGEYRIVRHYYY